VVWSHDWSGNILLQRRISLENSCYLFDRVQTSCNECVSYFMLLSIYIIHKGVVVCFVQICTFLMKDEPGPSSETHDWDINVKFKEDDPLDISFPVGKAEPGVSCTFVPHIRDDIHNLRDWCSHLYTSCSSAMQRLMIVLAYLRSQCTQFRADDWCRNGQHKECGLCLLVYLTSIPQP
jgi:hypothetical protein